MIICGCEIPPEATDFFAGEWTQKWLRNRDGDPEVALTPIKAAEYVVRTFDPYRCESIYTGNQAEFWLLLVRGKFKI